MNSQVATSAPSSVFHGLSTSKETQHISHWEQQLRHAPARLDLHLGHATAPSPGGQPGRYDVTLPSELVAGLLALSKAEHVTPLVTVFAAATALLARYSDSSHVSFGYPHLDTTDSLLGLTYRLLQADLHGTPSFRSLLQRSSATLAQARGHGAIPAAHLAALLNPQRDDAVPSFFQFLFAYAGCADEQLDATCWLQAGGLADTAAELALVFQQDGAQLTATFGYQADRFAATTIERMAYNFVALLAAALAAPDQPVFSLPMLSATEQAQLASWSRNDVPFQLACLHQLIGMQAARTPHATALLFDGGQLSYAELEAQANQLAHYLRQHGVGPDRIVAVCMGRGKDLILTLLAILKAGGAYLPLDPIYPAARLAEMIEDAEPVALLSDGSLPDELLEQWGHTPPLPVLELHAAAPVIRSQPIAPPAELASLDSLAYIIYTSGSTGKPKGVLVEHRSVASFVFGGGQVYQFTAADRGLHFSSVSFDASVEEMFIPLVHGAALAVTEGYSPPDFAQLQAAIVRHGITSVALPTAYWHTWISELSAGHGSIPPSVRQVIVGGEAASGERYNRWRALVPPTVRLVNGYGPTEATVASIWYSPSPLADEPNGPLPIGRPYPNQHIYLLDAEQRPVPVGVQGELYLGGVGVARGYHNRPELTAERFVMVDGLESGGPVRLYRTGDLARWRDDGNLLYEGRADQQVKVRGYRIEPGEVEATLHQHAAVQAAVVTTHPHNGGEVSLFGYVVLKEPLEMATLRAFLEERLPHYMVPSALLTLDALPLTPGGKVDRRALPAPVLPASSPSALDERARTPVEQLLTSIWEELLGRRGIGLHDDFFALGGHSLLAMRMLSRVATELGARLPVSIMIHHPTIAELAHVISHTDQDSAWSVLVPIQPAGDRPPLFCVHGITGDVLWFQELGHCLAPDQPLYGLQSRSLDANQAHATSIEEMAAGYIDGMRSVQPHGPYHIAGASFGGVVALEMARQLEAAGEGVGLLAIFDYDPYQRTTGLRAYGRDWANYLRYLPRWIRNYVLTLSRDELRTWARWRLRMRVKRLVSLLLGGATLPTDAADIIPYGAELPLHRRELLLANEIAFERYLPRPYGGRVTLFATDGWYTMQATTTGTSGWAALARGGVEIVAVPGSHESMFKQPHVAELAAHLRRALGAVAT